MTTKTTSTHKLQVARKIERSRIWLEGKRLDAHKFNNGVPFSASWSEGKLVLTFLKTDKAMDETETRNLYVVAGTVDRPIIDITGEKVRDAFKGFTHISVKWEQGKLTITGAKE